MFPKQQRKTVESRVQEIVAKNQLVEDALPKGIQEEDYWKQFRRKAWASTVYVRRLPLEEGHVDKQMHMYLVDMKEVDGISVVIMTYADGDSVGECFEVELSRIVAIE